jgi:hypothetical protein
VLRATLRETTTSIALDITKQAYEAFSRRDIPALLKLVADAINSSNQPPQTGMTQPSLERAAH